MEWLIVLAFAAGAALLVGAARPAPPSATDELEWLEDRRRALLAELRELDEDAAAGHIAPADRLDGRRALGPELRAVTEALRERGAVDPEST